MALRPAFRPNRSALSSTILGATWKWPGAFGELLPLDGGKPMSFFPETGKDAAPEVANALIRSFLTSFGIAGKPPLAPWKLTTDDVDLASAVGEEFKKLGILQVLWKIQYHLSIWGWLM